MKFLFPAGGLVDERFGYLVSPATKGIPAAVRQGLDWAADNQAFTQGFNPSVFLNASLR